MAIQTVKSLKAQKEESPSRRMYLKVNTHTHTQRRPSHSCMSLHAPQMQMCLLIIINSAVDHRENTYSVWNTAESDSTGCCHLIAVLQGKTRKWLETWKPRGSPTRAYRDPQKSSFRHRPALPCWTQTSWTETTWRGRRLSRVICSFTETTPARGERKCLCPFS